MPRTITIDNVDLLRLQFLKTPDGDVQVYAEYSLKAGDQVFQMVHKDVTVHLGNGRKTAAAALLATIAQDINDIELA